MSKTIPDPIESVAKKKGAAIARYEAAAHAMQSGVAASLQFGYEEVTPKHLRVGINSAMSDHAALVTLLLAKGIITELEYFEALADSMEKEKANYEKKLGVELA